MKINIYGKIKNCLGGVLLKLLNQHLLRADSNPGDTKLKYIKKIKNYIDGVVVIFLA